MGGCYYGTYNCTSNKLDLETSHHGGQELYPVPPRTLSRIILLGMSAFVNESEEISVSVVLTLGILLSMLRTVTCEITVAKLRGPSPTGGSTSDTGADSQHQ